MGGLVRFNYPEAAVKTQRTADIAAGCFIAVFGVFVLFSSMGISVAGVHRLSPRTFPYVVGILLLLCGIGLAVRSSRLRGEDRAIPWPDGKGIQTIVVTLLGLAAYIAVMGRLGMPLATFLYIALYTWYLKPSRWWLALLIGLIVAVLTYTVFIRLLGLSLPAGEFLEG
jgi:putative tricarboxylic transport membrane protein